MIQISDTGEQDNSFTRPVLIKPDGCVEALNGKRSLKMYQDAVDGLIAPVPVPHLDVPDSSNFIGLVNDEGLLRDMDYNAAASMICGQVIVGNLLILRDEWFD